MSTAPESRTIVCSLFSCFIVICYWFLVITKHEYILVVGFHKVVLASYLCDGLRVALQFLYLLFVLLILHVVGINLLLQLTHEYSVAHMLQQAVLIEEPDNEDTENYHNPIFVVTYKIQNRI